MEFSIPVIRAGGENPDETPTEVEPPSEPAEEPTEPTQPVQPTEPTQPGPVLNNPTESAHEDNRFTIRADANGYAATVSMDNPIPFSRNRRALANSLHVTSQITDADGNSTGIFVKSVKCSKAKGGRTKTTVKLKGTTKAEKRAVKQMNKSLKKISVDVEG